MKASQIRKKYWITADGIRIKYKNLGDTHLKNIVNKLLKNNMDIPSKIKEEYFKRGFGKIEERPTIEQLMVRLEILEQKVETLQKFGEL
jgi:hypothetical protein